MPLTISDLQVLARSDAADLSETILRFLGQPDPESAPTPKDALDPERFQDALQESYQDSNTDRRRRRIALLWRQYLTQTTPPPAPRFLLADFLVSLYESGEETARSALVELASTAPLRVGIWGGLKRIYKLAEQRHDVQLFGALAARFDRQTSALGCDVRQGTLIYLRRRAWRYLRLLGQAMPELYPQFAAGVLVHVPGDQQLEQSWIANHILRHDSDRDGYGFHGPMPTDLVKHRAFDEAWKATSAADSLMLLLEECQHDLVAYFAIQGLKRDFPQLLRSVDPRWLERIARRRLASVHDFVVDTLQGSPEFHAANLRKLELHETVLSLLLSPSQKARRFAIEYARTHAQDLTAERLVEYASGDVHLADTIAWAGEALQRIPPRTIGYLLLGRLLATPLREWATACLERHFDRSELPQPWLVDLFFTGDSQRKWVLDFLTQKYAPGELGAEIWKKILTDPRALEAPQGANLAFKKLLELQPEAVGGDWVLEMLKVQPWRRYLLPWLEKVEVLPGASVEQIKGLVFDPQLRSVSLTLLGRPRIARFTDLGLPWLLALARRSDPVLHDWAGRYLLQNLSPGEFANGDTHAGVIRLLELATGAKEPEQVRSFAQTFLTCHHPTIGPGQPQSVSFQLEPRLSLEDYRPEPFWVALRDPRPDVRRFAAVIAKASLRRWGYHTRVYELADSEYKEVRLLAFDALLHAGQVGADPQCTLEPKEIDPARVFALTESPIRQTRELAMELIARHYDTLGGTERLGWLMASSDRVIRQMAVRLLWDRHRPRRLPPEWKPRGEPLAPLDDSQRFTDVDGLRTFLRTLLFGLPPGRDREPAQGETGIRKVAAGVAKRRAVESARDLALDDENFARVLSPLLLEFTGSIARGEWQSCLAALASLQRAHPGLDLGLEKRS